MLLTSPIALGPKFFLDRNDVAWGCSAGSTPNPTFFFLFLTLLVVYIITGNPGAEDHYNKHGRLLLEHSTSEDVGIDGGRPMITMKDAVEDDPRDEDDQKTKFTWKRDDPNQPYSFGPKISDWDKQRSRWLQSHPEFPNFVAPGKPRVLLATGSFPKPCENPVGDHYLLKSIKNKIDYCRLNGHAIFYNLAILDDEMTNFWTKLPLIRTLLLAHPEVEFIWWMDSDAMFTDMAFEVPWERYGNHNLVMDGWDEKVYEQRNWLGVNTGVFLIRNCQWTLDLLDAWAPMGPKGKVREDAGKLLSKHLHGRPEFEADDQSAIVYLLATQKEKWAGKVYLENQYCLHGYWGMVVDRYEEMIEKYHPGLGDHRWPLVTHFVGCKPCGKFGVDYSAERCLKQMERAFNFGDNQIVQMYGYVHKSLGSWRLKRKRNEADKPTLPSRLSM